MEIKRTEDAGMITLAVSGSLSAATEPEFSKAMNAAIADAKDITVDLTDLEYLASAGLRAFVSAQKQMDAIDKKLALAHVQEDVMEVFTITGLDDVFTFE